MPKFKDGFRTTLGLRLNTVKVHEALAESLIRDNLLNTSSLDVKNPGEVHPVFITGLHDSEDRIPMFVHPYYMETPKGKLLATDMRHCVRKTYDGNPITLPKAIMSQTEFNFSRTRAILNLEWLEGDVDAMRTRLYFASALFGRWIASILAGGFALDARDQLVVAIASTYYYQALFTDKTEPDPDTLQQWQIHTVKVTFAPPEMVREVFSKMPVIKGVESLIEAIQAATDNVRLNNLNVVTLLTSLKQSWFGTNAKEIITVATEHPPTWIAVVYAALSERGFRDSLVYKIADRVGKRGITEDFIREMEKILSEYALPDSYTTLMKHGLV